MATTKTDGFTKATTVGQAYQMHPEVKFVFASYHLGGCSSCAVDNAQTLEQVSVLYGIALEPLLDDLNALLQ